MLFQFNNRISQIRQPVDCCVTVSLPRQAHRSLFAEEIVNAQHLRSRRAEKKRSAIPKQTVPHTFLVFPRSLSCKLPLPVIW